MKTETPLLFAKYNYTAFHLLFKNVSFFICVPLKNISVFFHCNMKVLILLTIIFYLIKKNYHLIFNIHLIIISEHLIYQSL